jgi:hypothetical protein
MKESYGEGFQSRTDADRFWKELGERFAKFRLELHPEKTRLLEFGPFAADNRKKRGQGKPETFDFIGFTHICGKKRNNEMFTVLRQTIRKRVQAKLSEVKLHLKRRMHDPVPEVGKWLHSVVGGHVRYYGVPIRQSGSVEGVMGDHDSDSDSFFYDRASRRARLILRPMSCPQQ